MRTTAMTIMLRYMVSIKLAAALSLSAACAALAQDSIAEPPVSSALTAMVVERAASGEERFRPADEVIPGDIIEYRIAYRNQSGGALSGFIVEGPIPAGAIYVAGSAANVNDAALEVLVDGEDWQREPAYKTVTTLEGARTRIPATPSDYRAIRWILTKPLSDQTAVAGVYRIQVRQ